MQPATPRTVLGQFDDVTVEHYGIRSRLFRQGDAFWVHTEGPDGTMQDFRVDYVLGVAPLQQYMVEFPQSPEPDGPTSGLPRIQVLPLCWDTVNHRWFYLDPPDVSDRLDPRDDLHWTGIAQRWNTMCGECHTTDFRKNFTPGPMTSLADHAPARVNQADHRAGTYQSNFSEMNVSCEACHGPASVHLELARQRFPGWNRQRGYGLANLKLSAEHQIQSCAPCHSRRGVIHGGYRSGEDFHDYFQSSLLTWPTYYPDGQLLDENFEHGSFVQSKMYHKGIRCTDCHDPHSARLKHQGNELCTSCHQHPAARYDSAAHHFHQPGSPGSQCVNCHMPTTTYMNVHARRDHSLRIPRPDLSLQLGTPNACAACHLEPGNIGTETAAQLALYQDWLAAARAGDQPVVDELDRANRWCDQACEKWYGPLRRREEHWGLAIAAGQNRQPDAVERLQRLLATRGEAAPAIARATALQVLGEIDPVAAGQQAVLAVGDAHPLVRSVAVSGLSGLPVPTQAVGLLEEALSDPSRLVRIEAARQLLDFPRSLHSSQASGRWQQALSELKQGAQYNNDRAGGHLMLGGIAERLGMDRQAIEHYETSIVVEPAATGPRTNLAALVDPHVAVASRLSGRGRSRLQTQIAELRRDELQLLARDVRCGSSARHAGISIWFGGSTLTGRSRPRPSS